MYFGNKIITGMNGKLSKQLHVMKYAWSYFDYMINQTVLKISNEINDNKEVSESRRTSVAQALFSYLSKME